jgi:hypothetical protein
MKVLTALFSTAVLLLPGCHGLTEYEGEPAAQVLFYSTSDLSFTGSIGGITDGRALCSIDSRTLYVLDGSGMLHKLDSDEMTVDTSFQVLTGPAAGVFALASPPPRSSIYAFGPTASIVEVGVASNTVLDIFQAGPSPSCMVPSRSGASKRLYVGDSEDDCLREVATSTNTVVHTTQLGFPPGALTFSGCGPWIMAVCGSEGILAVLDLQYSSPGYHTTPAGMSDVTTCGSMPDFFLSCPQWGDVGLVLRTDSLGEVTGSRSIPGHPIRLAGSIPGLPVRLFVLSNTGDGTCSVSILDCYSLETEAEIDLDGYPWDMVLHRNGEYLAVLMSN